MDMLEVRRCFTAYGSGEIAESELRGRIRRALSVNPRLSTAYIALAEAYRRANIIDVRLHSTINADIAEITSPPLGNTRVGPGANPESTRRNSSPPDEGRRR